MTHSETKQMSQKWPINGHFGTFAFYEEGNSILDGAPTKK